MVRGQDGNRRPVTPLSTPLGHRRGRSSLEGSAPLFGPDAGDHVILLSPEKYLSKEVRIILEKAGSFWWFTPTMIIIGVKCRVLPL